MTSQDSRSRKLEGLKRVVRECQCASSSDGQERSANIDVLKREASDVVEHEVK